MHLLVDRGGFGHHEESLGSATGVEDIDGFQSHLLETGKVQGRLLVTGWVVGGLVKVVLVDVAVKPNRHVGHGENTKCLAGIRGLCQGGLIKGNGVTSLSKFSVVIFALERILSRVELFGTTTKLQPVNKKFLVMGVKTYENISTGIWCPRVICNTVESLIDQVSKLRSKTGVASQGNRSCVGKLCSRNNTDSRSPNSSQQLNNSFDLGIVKRIFARIGINAHCIDSTLVSGVQGRSTVGRVGDVGVKGVGLTISPKLYKMLGLAYHLMSQYWELVHLHGGLIFAIDRFVSN